MTALADRVRGHHLLGPAGHDGPWTVHRARSATTGADVLVKTLACHRVDKRALKRIIRGFGFPAELSAHGGVIPVLEVGATGDGRPYLVTPPHDGPTLAERPGRDRPMPLDQAAALVAAVARAVAATHAAGGVHGRVIPENIVPAGNGVKLTGFAMSALMSIVELPDGTPPSVHASPEELEGRPPVPASDVYALASTAYELLTGRPPFALDGNVAKFALAVLTEAPPPLPASVPEDLAATLIQALSKDPAARPAATDLATTADKHAAPAHNALPQATGTPTRQHPPAGVPTDQRGPANGPHVIGGEPGGAAGSRPPFGEAGGPLPAGHPSGSSAAPSAQSAAELPRTALLPEPGPQLPRTARLPVPGAPGYGEPSSSAEQSEAKVLSPAGPPGRGEASGTGQGEVSGAERSGPRELVWTVDSERSRVRPPAGPQPFLPPPPEASAPAQAQDAAQERRRGRMPLIVAGVSALAVLAGAGSVALAMSGDRGVTLTADSGAGATPPGDSAVQDDQSSDDRSGDGRPQDGVVHDGRPQSEQPQDTRNRDGRQQPDARATGGQPQAVPSPAPEQGTADPATSPPATLRTPDPATLTAYRPKNLKLVADNGTTVTLSWKSARKTQYPVIVQQAPDDRLMSAPSGSTTYTVGKLDPGTGYCFKVGAVVALGQPSSVAWSSSLCIRGAAETGTEDDVQPPIVLPLVTPPSS
ncbi:protein kinase [Nonomuraea sp. NPDC052634]|uniref:protein kinase domain-containing protein n=1 Tax=Nonomuraea sp. NPDC052634 TaxID=3155813 RepID=UPI003435A0E8